MSTLKFKVSDAPASLHQRDIKIDKRIAALRAILSPVTKQVIEDRIHRFFKDCGHKTTQFTYKLDSDYYGSGLVCYVDAGVNLKFYDWIISQPETSVGEYLRYYKTINMVLVSHMNTPLRLILEASCELPKDDFITLDLLGKVHRTVRPAAVDTSIYCEIN